MNLSDQTTKNGPVGGPGGKAFQIEFSSIKSIELRGGAIVDSIMVTDHDGKEHKAGGDGGAPIKLELAKDEQITKINGKFGKYIGQMTVETSAGQHISSGNANWESGAEDFSFEAGNDPIVGFFGTAGSYLDSFGIVQIKNPLGDAVSGSPFLG